MCAAALCVKNTTKSVPLAGFHNFRREFAMSLFHTFPICRIQICKERELLRIKKTRFYRTGTLELEQNGAGKKVNGIKLFSLALHSLHYNLPRYTCSIRRSLPRQRTFHALILAKNYIIIAFLF